MGLWGMIKELGGMMLEGMNAQQERVRSYKAKYENYSDDELIRRYKSASGEAKMACASLLRERGYDRDSIN